MKYAAAALLFLLFFFLLAGSPSPEPYRYDEADYMFAASRGLLANALDRPTLPIGEFVRLGLRGGGRSQLSELIRKSGDVAFYRHWHGPLYYYWLALLSPWKQNEQFVRAASMVFPVGTLLIACFGSLWILPGAAGRLAAVLSSALVGGSLAVVRTTEIAPHQLFVLCSLASLVLMAKASACGGRRLWYGAVVASALAFCTMEISFVPILALLIFGYTVRAPLGGGWRLLAASILVFLVAVLVAWPAALFKLTFLKAYAMQAYLAVARRSAWGEATLADTWISRLTTSPLEWILAAAALWLWIRSPKSAERRALSPFVIYFALMLVALLPVRTPGIRYTLPLVPALCVFPGLAFGRRLAAWRPAARAAVVLALGALQLAWAGHFVATHPLLPDPRPRQVLAAVRDLGLENKTLLVPHDEVPFLHYYLPGATVGGYVDEAEKRGALARGGIDAVLEAGDPVRFSIVTSPPGSG